MRLTRRLGGEKNSASLTLGQSLRLLASRTRLAGRTYASGEALEYRLHDGKTSRRRLSWKRDAVDRNWTSYQPQPLWRERFASDFHTDQAAIEANVAFWSMLADQLLVR